MRIPGFVVGAARASRTGGLLVLAVAAGCDKAAEDTGPAVDLVPSVGAVAISPLAPTATDTLTCAWTGFSDPEGAVDLSFVRWSAGGVSLGEGRTLSAGFTKGDVVTCEVIPFDGALEGAAVSAEVTIGNALPSVSVALLGPDDLRAGDTATCSWVGFEDVDGDADLSTVTWAINGFDVGTGPTYNGDFASGDTLACFVTAFDGTDTGGTVSDAQVVGNAVPEIGAVVVAPSPAYVGDDLTCSWTGYADPDGDPDQSSVQWRIGGEMAGSGPLLAGGFRGGDRVECIVTPYDGVQAGAAQVGSIVVENSIPTVAALTLSPADASAIDVVSCTWSGFDDPDGDPDVSRRTWYVDGRAVGSGETLSGAFRRDEEVRCEVVPFDGFDAGDPLEASLVVSNAPPGVGLVTITPERPGVEDTLTCAWTGFVDLDGDADQSVVTWTVDGRVVGHDPTLAGAFTGRDRVDCTVVPYDGTDAGEARSATVVVGNAAPTITGVSIEPDPAFATDSLTCVWTGFVDEDGDPDQTRVEWTVDGVAAGAGAVLLPGAFVRGDLVSCTATPSDGYASGAPLTAATTIGNSAPAALAVAITPDPAVAGDVLRCGYTFSDPDGDGDASTVVWAVGGAAAGSGPTLSGGFGPGDVVSCEVTPSDGTLTGSQVGTSIVVNSPPSVASVDAGPVGAGAGTPLTCAWGGFTDVDGDSDLSTVRWWRDEVSLGSGSPLAPGGYVRGDLVRCEVQPFDGYSFGVTQSDGLAIVNTAPSIASVVVSPDAPAVGTDLTCAWAGFTDVDGDADASTVAWWVDGALVGTGPLLDGGAFGGGDVVTCEVTPFDGETAGAARSDSVTAINAAPVLVSVSLSPDPPATDDVLVAIPVASDPDGDPLSYTYAWTVNGVGVAETGPSLDGTIWFTKGEVVTVTGVASDGSATSAPVAAAPVTVVNSAPGAPVVEIDGASGGFLADGDDVVCVVTGEAPDADGDVVSYLYSWFVNGGFYPDFDDTVSASVTAVADTWSCTVTPTDGVLAGATGSASVTIGTPLAGDVPDALTPDGSPYFLRADALAPGDLVIAPGVWVEGGGHRLVVVGVVEIDGAVLRDVVFEADGGSVRDSILEGSEIRGPVQLRDVERAP